MFDMTNIRALIASVALMILTFIVGPLDPPSQQPIGVVPGRTPWDKADSAYFADAQRRFSFMDDPQEGPARCAWTMTPCGRPTHVRAWADLH